MGPQEILKNKDTFIKYFEKNGFNKVDYKDEEYPEGTYIKIDRGKLLALYEIENEKQIREIKNHFLIERGLSYCVIIIKGKIIFYRNFGEGRYFLYSERTKDHISKLDKLENIKDDFDILFHRTDISGVFYESFKEKRNYLVRNIKNEISYVKKLLIAQKIFDRIFFIYFLCHKNIIKFKDGRSISGENLFELLIENGGFYDSLKKVFYSFNTYNKMNVVRIKEHEILIPYLNGGLFRLDPIEPELEFNLDRKDWKDIFNFLNKYHWIIEEDIDLGIEEDIELDQKEGTLTPEILGHVYERSVIEWENLEGFEEEAEKAVKKLSERKKKGVYYTPSEITRSIAEETIYPHLFENVVLEKTDINQLIEKLSKEEIQQLYKKLSEIKVLDPACGSGAFLIKASELIFFLKVRLLSQLQKDLNYYDIKLNIITDNIYGVDILEGAIEIAKLRLWLWLITDYEDETEIKALPNIEYNLKVGNSLIGWTNEELTQVSLKRPLTDEIRGIFIGLIAYSNEEERKLYGKARDLLASYKLENYIEAYSILYKIYRKEHGIKAENLKGIIEKIRGSIYDSINSTYLEYVNTIVDSKYNRRKKPPISQEKFSSLIPFHWRVDFGEIFKNGGFDVIVGNPPYVRSVNLKQDEKTWLYYKKKYQTAFKEFDIYLCFLEKAYNLLASDGRLGYIMPNKWLHAQMGESARVFFSENRAINKIVNFNSFQIFEGSTTYTMLIYLRKNENDSIQVINYVGNADAKKIHFDSIESETWELGKLEYSDLNGSPWNLITGDTEQILNKMSIYPEFGQYYTLSQGTGTRADKVFFIEKMEETDRYYKIFSKETNKEHIIEKMYVKPSAKGKDLDSYEIKNRTNLLIFPYNDRTLIEAKEIKRNSPKLWEYLEECRDALGKREKGRWKGDSFYRFSYPRSHQLLDQKKIVVPVIVNQAKAAWDPIGLHVIDSVYILRKKKQNNLKSEYILALLNSKLLTYFLTKTSSNLRGGYFSMKPGYVDKFPLKMEFTTNKEKDQYEEIIRKVSRINSITNKESKKAKEEILLLKEEIDNLIFNLYGLNKKEIDVIKSQLRQ